MTEPESYLRLGIEAAREENKEEARRFFRLLTRKDPDNVQGWLWLAGVAENREERQDALEHVLRLDPDNEMAQKGLKALGVYPVAAEPPPAVEPLPPAAASDPYADDDPYGELDNLSDVMAADTAGPVRRSEAFPSPIDAAESAEAGAAASSAAASAAAARRAETSARSASAAAQRSARDSGRYVDDDELEQPRRGLSPLLALLLFLVGLGLIGLLIASLFPGWFGGGQVAEGDATAAALTAEAGPAATSVLGGEGGTAQPGTTTDPNATVDPNATAPAGGEATADPNATAPAGGEATPDPNATAPAGGEGTAEPGAPPADVSAANPAILPANSPIQSEGWLYDFPQPTYAASIIGNLGQFTPNNGRFVVVLLHAVNNTGTPQAIPPSFFVLKDAQGRVWEARPEVSDAYVIPGVNADQTHNTPIPPDGNYRSVALVFDVAPDATDLVFFARSNPSQGWIVLRSV